MERDGFEVVRGVLSEDEAEELAAAALEEMDTRANMAHSDAIWRIRLHPNVLAQFRRLWGVEDIVTSFDGIGLSHGEFTLPWHVDQERHSAEMVGLQGILALSNQTAESGGLQLIRGSFEYHSGLVDPCDADEWEYQEIEADLSSCDVVMPNLRPGDMCLWDSRTIHRVVRGTTPNVPRITAYLSFEPRRAVTRRVALQRTRGLRQGISTTHWVSRFVDRGDAWSPPSNITPEMLAVT
jgi:ectoine hydroxylase-related dioxygenase (phytanoyl-CoA dioxygenase family)